ncbi:predicted protein [Sclerotinia sclerotiorum 1980 UF-70]|uniref:Uncharacterized protein n=2 Tax=Sclerotinia sclerotiorum (strain ATCC 18683 / 1980 / Ss-1) TaxID=665079 RepID=A7F8V6_SCLS1|nr:predicted protein [Sclerotinia sclerotiorum 1980 UF-70]APA13140.1 hypothetical protein sscle_10g079100 [Sclerotinia sclerotiorum 1980 UF-70]EDN99177.1 predicted protein [Sclerotinia sclerotiorum 1980 UF-70]
MDIETFKQLLPFLPKLINYAKTCYKWLKDSGISNESISWGAAFVLAVGLILLSVYYVLKSFFEFVEHLAGYFFGFFKDLSKYKRAFRFLKHFLNSIQPSAVIASLSVLFIFHRKLDSDLGQNQRLTKPILSFGFPFNASTLEDISNDSILGTQVLW